MKTSKLSCLRLIAFLLAVIVGRNEIRGEGLLFQFPLSRSSHSFSLWEAGASEVDGVWFEPPPDIQGFTSLSAGWYRRTPITNLSLVGGSFDAGVWLPGSDTFLQGVVDRSAAGSFFVMNDSAGEIAPANSTLLAQAAWAPLNGAVPLMFFSLPADRANNLLVLQASGGVPGEPDAWSGWYRLTVNPVQAYYDIDDTMQSLGFADAWTAVAAGVTSFRVFDLTDNDAAPSSATDLAAATWTPETDFFPVRQVQILVPDAHLYELVCPEGEAAFPYTSGDSPYFVDVAVGYGREFWLRRISDGYQSNHWTVPWGMESGTLTFDATADFGVGGGAGGGWVTQHFRIDAGHNPWALRVVHAGNPAGTPLTVSSTESGTYLNGVNGPETVWVGWYDCWATIDVSSGWHLETTEYNNLGQGPDWIEWPESYQTGVVTTYLPASRRDHPLRSAEGFTLSFQGSSGTQVFYDAFTFESYSVAYDYYELPIANWPANYLEDQSTGEISSSTSPGSYGSPDYTWMHWHQLLKAQCCCPTGE